MSRWLLEIIDPDYPKGSYFYSPTAFNQNFEGDELTAFKGRNNDLTTGKEYSLVYWSHLSFPGDKYGINYGFRGSKIGL